MLTRFRNGYLGTSTAVVLLGSSPTNMPFPDVCPCNTVSHYPEEPLDFMIGSHVCCKLTTPRTRLVVETPQLNLPLALSELEKLRLPPDSGLITQPFASSQLKPDLDCDTGP